MLCDPRSVERLSNPKNAERVRLRRTYKGLNLIFNRDRSKVAIYFRGQPMKCDPVKDPAGFRDEYARVERGEPAPEKGQPLRKAAQGTWNAAIELLLDTPYWKGLATNTLRIYRPLVETIRVSDLGKTLMKQTNPWTVREIHDAVLAAKGANAANAFQTVLKHIVEVGEINGWVRDNVNLMRGVKLQEVDHKHYQPYDGRDIDRWKATHVEGTMAHKAFEMVYWLALATVDLVQFAPKDIDDMGNVLVSRSKTGNGQYANIHDHPELLAVIESFDRTGKDPSVPFLHTKTGKPYLENTFRLDWRKWRKEAGVINPNFAVHSGRATLVTDMKDAGIAVEDGMTRTGHADPRVYNDIYGHAANKVIAARRASSQLISYRGARKASSQGGLRVVS